MKYNKHIKELLRGYLERTLNKSEEEELMTYLRDNGMDEDGFTEIMEDVWEKEPSERNNSEEVDQEFSQIRKKISAKAPLYKRLSPYMRYAAAVLVFIAGTMAWYKYSNRPVENQQVAIAMSSKTTQIGEKVKITLSDGTVIYLAGNSTLRWPDNFVRGQHRKVYLDGEAFFQVKSDSLSPFIVHSGNLQTRVLGTSFNIYAYPEDSEITVSVSTGKVEVSQNDGDLLSTLSFLTPGMKLVFDKAEKQYAVTTGQADDFDGWVKNRFVFKDTDLPKMLEKLGRYYKVNFKYNESCLGANNMFNAAFENMNIKDILEQIHLMSGGNIRYSFDNEHEINLWKEGCR